MNIGHFFIDRPIFAVVISIAITLFGVLAYFSLPVSQYPQIAPPMIQVNASYPGASAETVAKTVATTLEQEITGVDNMLYMSSQSTNDGNLSIKITFAVGTDLDNAQVQVQNRISRIISRLPQEVRQIGVSTNKSSPNMMMVINLSSPNKTYDEIYIANYAILKIKDRLTKIPGVGDVWVFGAGEYAMRIWLDPDKMAALKITANDVIDSLSNQNIQVGSGILNQPPMPKQNMFELNIQVKGRLSSIEEFNNIIIKSNADGKIVHLKDVGAAKLGATNYKTKGYVGNTPSIFIPIFQKPGSNALDTAKQVFATMDAIKKDFPKDLVYDAIYNPTEYVDDSIDEVLKTILEATVFVMLVMFLFLQNWRSALIPIIAIPVSLIGTFAIMKYVGLSLNTLSLFGLVLAIGIVVDDAIVVVENMQRYLAKGLSPREAGKKTMTEISSALIATSLVLVAAFLPGAFMSGVSGVFFQQFGFTIATATIISTIISLSLSPALGVLFLRKNKEKQNKKIKFFPNPISWFFHSFDRLFVALSGAYTIFIKKIVRMLILFIIFYLGLAALATWQFKSTPTGFIPAQDQGYLITVIELPAGVSLSRTDDVLKKVINKVMKIDGVKDTVAFAGLSAATFTNSSSSAAMFIALDDADKRQEKGRSSDVILVEVIKSLASISEAFIIAVPPPPVPGVGNAGGFNMMIQDKQGLGSRVLEQATWGLAMAANQHPNIVQSFTTFDSNTPKLYLDIDREKAKRLNIPLTEIFSALQIFLGSSYVNDFNYLGRIYRVIVQAKSDSRKDEADISNIQIKSSNGDMLPLDNIATIKHTSAPSRIPRYNSFPAASLQGNTAPGISMGEALSTMEKLAEKVLPEGIEFEWTNLAFQQKLEGNTTMIAFSMAIIFIFLILAAFYESISLPLAILLIAPMSLLSSLAGVAINSFDNNILTQISFVVLIGLAAKNAILIVEFAKQQQDIGANVYDAVVEACKIRFRPIIMTAMAFILGVLPLVFASGAGFEMRQNMGVAVFYGMIGVTFFGLVFTPIFYVLLRKNKRKS